MFRDTDMYDASYTLAEWVAIACSALFLFDNVL
jgi:hypothetical protein